MDNIYVISSTAIILLLYCFYNFNKNAKIKKELKKYDNIINDFEEDVKELRKNYIRNSLVECIKKKYKFAFDELLMFNNIEKYDEKYGIFLKTYRRIHQTVEIWNREFVESELKDNEKYFSDIDGKSLDGQQRKAIVVNEDNNLIVASAGSGKTLTIAAKVKYLVEKKKISPDKILLISFTKKSAEELSDRVSTKSFIVEGKTFHKLGLDIITKVNKKRPEIFDDIYGVVNKFFADQSIIKNEAEKIITFFGNYFSVPLEDEKFENLGKKISHYRHLDLVTLRAMSGHGKDSNEKRTFLGEKVKSFEELMIANFLYLNGVKYEYEKEYKYNVGDKFRKKYRPDFYLVDYDLYLEHFGINEHGKVPWLSKIEERKYIDDMDWKIKIHKENNTNLISSFSHFKRNGMFYIKLKKLLLDNRVELKKVNHEEIYKQALLNSTSKEFSEFKKLIVSFVNLFKGRGYSIKEFDIIKSSIQKYDNEFIKERSNLFIDISKKFYKYYSDILNSENKIDFNDMINIASGLLSKDSSSFLYEYIIIDEYQDISFGRYKLVKKIKELNNSVVMAVGDDWQSIYRFAGSDIGMFTNFESYMGKSEILKIEKTYRNSQNLIDMAGGFIMKNPRQFKKNLISSKKHSSPIRIVRSDFIIEDAIISILNEIYEVYGESANVMFIGRNNFDIETVSKCNSFKIQRSAENILISSNKFPKMHLYFVTAHRSKGLEEDNVIILNMRDTMAGFPNKISDDPVLSLVLTDEDDYTFSEERRLFYVALTRTRNITYLIAPYIQFSSFISELIDDYDVHDTVLDSCDSSGKSPKCPVCMEGDLVLRKNNSGSGYFLGCSNYPMCQQTYKEVSILDDQIICQLCQGYMVRRNSAYGEFFGCTNYPYCKNTLRISN